MAEAPLKGIRVIELARILAGPWAGQMLADLGADVIKVENPDGGDDTRKWGPPFVTSHDGENLSAAYYHACNRGKRSIALDFSTPEGAGTVRRLAASADVPCVFHCSHDFGLKTATMLHGAASSPNMPLANDCTYYGLESDILKVPHRITRGTMPVPETPGLGVEVDMELVRKYLVK